jgi:hypothetical protein
MHIAPWERPETKADTAAAGQEMAMVLEYTVSAAASGETDIVEIRRITFAGNVLVEVKNTIRAGGGPHRTLKKITLPQAAVPGSYSLVGIIRVEGREYQRRFDFKIIE